jgi:hypothetical protein
VECRAFLVYAQLVSAGLNLDEVRYGQLLTILTSLLALFVLVMVSKLLDAIA